MCLDPISRVAQSYNPVGNQLGISAPTDKLIGKFSPINTNDPLTTSLLKKPQAVTSRTPAGVTPGYGLTINRGVQ